MARRRNRKQANSESERLPSQESTHLLRSPANAKRLFAAIRRARATANASGSMSQQGSAMKGVQFLVDDGGNRTAVVIDLKRNAKLWEDFFDRALAESRAGEPRESLESVKERLKNGRGLAGR